tara:strand:+ start:1102 stop:1431 length:330 start_codon:yes stop_codon:yes gene_type:complete
MDSKNIYIAAQNTSRLASWIGDENDGWVFIGDGKDFDSTTAQDAIDSFFKEESVYLSVNRHQGFEVSTSKAGWELRKHIDAGAWLVNPAFKKVMVFSKTGVYRCGKVAS